MFKRPTLGDYQTRIIDEVARSPHPLIPLPTGGGKTVVAAAIIEDAATAGLRVIFAVHRRELMVQVSTKLFDVGVDHAILMGAESTDYIGQRCIVASVQTLHSRVFRHNRIPLLPCDILFFDEAHHSAAQTYLEIRNAYPNAKRIGLTATPARGDGAALGGELFSNLVPLPTYRWLIDHKYLVPSIVYAPVVPDLRGVKTLSTGDYSPSELEARIDTSALRGGILEHWWKLASDRPTILFTAGVKHSIHLRDEFLKSGVTAAHIDALTPLSERKRITAAFRAGEIRVLCEHRANRAVAQASLQTRRSHSVHALS